MAGQVEIEARAYGPESTPEEIAAIRSRLNLVDGKVLLWREMPVMSAFTVDLCFDRAEELCRTHGCRVMIVDASTGTKPDAAGRRRIFERVSQLGGRLVHVALVIDANPLVRAAARFVQAGLPIGLSIHNTFEAAMEEVHRVDRR
ncbi:MAG: hypothetical protein KC431_26145 [Myxococcales bacterium]|nr:hypothetical protein [Myxococcales bacterium]